MSHPLVDLHMATQRSFEFDEDLHASLAREDSQGCRMFGLLMSHQVFFVVDAATSSSPLELLHLQIDGVEEYHEHSNQYMIPWGKGAVSCSLKSSAIINLEHWILKFIFKTYLMRL